MNGYDLAYYALLGAGAPIWATRRRTREKVRDALNTRRGDLAPRVGTARAVLVHAVSVGELNAARGLIDALQREWPGLHVIVTTTTTAGDALARERYANRTDVSVARFPLDLSASVERLLDAARPDLVVLMELEVWPNFMRIAESRGIPVIVANGRVTEPSARKYRLLGPLARSMFGRLSAAIVQDAVYADRFAAMGVPRGRVRVSGTMKFDVATLDDGADPRDVVPLSRELQRAFDLRDDEPVLVAGSTGLGEERIVLDAYRALLNEHPTLRLIVVPRKPERFDEVSELIAGAGFACVSRTKHRDQVASLLADRVASLPSVGLLDTIGELRAAYALARVVFVGRTLVDLGSKQHGSDMIEPCALARPTIVGPFTGNFEEPMRALRAAGAIVEIRAASELAPAIARLLTSPGEIGTKARDVVRAGRGALDRHLAILLPLLDRR